jgi:hypothetical protein
MFSGAPPLTIEDGILISSKAIFGVPAEPRPGLYLLEGAEVEYNSWEKEYLCKLVITIKQSSNVFIDIL